MAYFYFKEQPMSIEEKELQDYLFNNTGKIGIKKTDLTHKEFGIMPYGYIDIIAFSTAYNKLLISVVELKTDSFRASHLTQLYRYCTGIDDLFDDYEKRIVPILVNKESTTSTDDDVYLMNMAPGVRFYEYDLCIDNGIKIKRTCPVWTINKEWSAETTNNYARLVTKIPKRHRL